MKMKILVTGNKGFIGKNLFKKLEENSNFQTECLELDEFYVDEGTSINKLKDVLDEKCPQVIFHVGACSDTLETRVNYMMILNYESTKIICDWAKSNRAKIIYSSSAASYGTNNEFPSNLYGWSKYVGEGYVISNGGVALRYFNVYGPGEENKGKMSSVAYQSYLKYKNKEEIKLFPGKPRRDFVYVNDIVNANIFAMENYWNLSGDWYDIGSYEARSFEDVLKSMNINNWIYKKDEEVPKGYQFHTLAKKRMPGWNPKYTLESGIKEYVKYLNFNE
jgi:ADP-L-glycero-D-manno-heptose 6-epimerase